MRFTLRRDEELALALADEMIHQRYQPATPSFLNAGRKRGANWCLVS